MTDEKGNKKRNKKKPITKQKRNTSEGMANFDAVFEGLGITDIVRVRRRIFEFRVSVGRKGDALTVEIDWCGRSTACVATLEQLDSIYST
jgi:hypothetical protein